MAHAIMIDTIPGTGRSSTHLVRCGPANWVILQDGNDLALIDGGYPGNASDVEESVVRIGRSMGDVQGALLTHAHVDHLGGLAIAAERHGFSIHLDEAEAAHARGDVQQQISPIGICRLLPVRGTVPWLASVVRLGALNHQHVANPVSFAGSAPLDLPGAPAPVASHGHTDGHSAFLVADGEVLVSGDALVTGHPTSSRGTGPQLLPDPFHHDVAATHAALEHFSTLDATVLIPGHGPIYRGSVAEAVAPHLTADRVTTHADRALRFVDCVLRFVDRALRCAERVTTHVDCALTHAERAVGHTEWPNGQLSGDESLLFSA